MHLQTNLAKCLYFVVCELVELVTIIHVHLDSASEGSVLLVVVRAIEQEMKGHVRDDAQAL